jgi:hypothetical protein
MMKGPTDDPLFAWQDCYPMVPKRRIKVKDAKLEIQRAWMMWDGDKSAGQAMFIFYAWLTRYRPYFLTFRCKGDPWQKVHIWLLQYEQVEREKRERAGASAGTP